MDVNGCNDKKEVKILMSQAIYLNRDNWEEVQNGIGKVVHGKHTVFDCSTVVDNTVIKTWLVDKE